MIPNITKLPLRAPNHFGLDEDSSNKLEGYLDDESVEKLRLIRKDSRKESGSLSLSSWKRDDHGEPSGPGMFSVPETWMLSFQRVNAQEYIASGEYIRSSYWRPFTTRFQNDFLFAEDDQDVILADYEVFADASISLFIPEMGLNGKYDLYYGSEQVDISTLSLGQERFLWFDVTVTYDIENTNIKVSLIFAVHIEHTIYTDISVIVAEAKKLNEFRRSWGSSKDNVYDEYYEKYGEEFGEEYGDTEEQKEEIRRHHFENMRDLLEKHDNNGNEKEKVSGEWWLRSVTIQT